MSDPKFEAEPEQSWRSKLSDKVRKSPFVPLGAVCAFGALLGGIVMFHRNNATMQQRVLRARVIAQGTTVAVLAGAGLYHALKDPTPSDSAAAPARGRKDDRY